MSHRVCEMYDLYIVESIQHIILKCQGVNKEREAMYNQIYEDIPRLYEMFSDHPSEVPRRNEIHLLVNDHE